MKDTGVDLVVLEATGGYERPGVRAKTDQVDARTLRDFADVLARHMDRAKYITPMLEEQH